MNLDAVTDRPRYVVHRSVEPHLNVICTACGGPMEAALLDDLVAPDDRILSVRCPAGHASGQLRFTRGPQNRRAHAPGAVAVIANEDGDQRARCPCGWEGNFGIAGFVISDDLTLNCVVLGCGHGFNLRIDTTADFELKARPYG